MLCGSRAAKQRPCSRRLTAQAAVPAAATRCWAAWRSCSSCAFAMRSMAQPRRSRAERILAVISLKDGHFLPLGYASSGSTPRSCQSKHLVAERFRLVPRAVLLAIARNRHFAELSRERGSGQERRQARPDPRNALYVRYTGCLGRIVITEREKGSGSHSGYSQVSLYVQSR